MRKETIESFIKDTHKKIKDGKLKSTGGITRLLNALSCYIKYQPDPISYLEDLNELAFLQIRNLSAHSWYLFQQLRGNDPKPLKEFGNGTYAPVYKALDKFEKVYGWKDTFYAMLNYQRRYHPDPEGKSYSFNNPSAMK